ncbi:MAG: hypothetical protein H6557_24565 [Lewinellaceae bacterium]|nr:hypothetical protein [Phaeodactylibacter sp.]MCB9039805.1 hypothetical protein [Lewinellaceae bacterium]
MPLKHKGTKSHEIFVRVWCLPAREVTAEQVGFSVFVAGFFKATSPKQELLISVWAERKSIVKDTKIIACTHYTGISNFILSPVRGRFMFSKIFTPNRLLLSLPVPNHDL